MSSLIEKLKNKPKAQQKISISVGIRPKAKENIQLKTEVKDLRNQSLIKDRNEILSRYKAQKSIVKLVQGKEEQSISKRPADIPSEKKTIIKKPKKIKGKKLKIVGIKEGTISSLGSETGDIA